jgi:methylenetetrahydrofolate--tRNA-(uracil-5-)-methyltransferase
MKPVGLIDKRTGEENYAVVQLWQDNSAKTLFNLVGFQTNLKWGAQKELIHSIPGLENANIARYGVMHRNTFINSPQILCPTLETKERKGLFFAGQLTGTEGYTESIAGGLLAGINMARRVKCEELLTMPKETMLGGLMHYITDKEHLKHISHDGSLRYLSLQPTNSNWALLPPVDLPQKDRKNKKLKAELMSQRALNLIRAKSEIF